MSMFNDQARLAGGSAENIGGAKEVAAKFTDLGAMLKANEGGITFKRILWPKVIKTDKFTNPLNAYYLYYTTDHDASGGFYMMHGATPTGPWTYHGLVYQDTTSGSSSTETASPVWDDVANLWRFFYQQEGVPSANGLQTTISCTTTDGINFTRTDPATFKIDRLSSTATWGDGHTGYFQPFKIKGQYWSYHLLGSGEAPVTAMSKMGKNTSDWSTDYRPLGVQFSKVRYVKDDGVVRGLAWNNAFCFESGGKNFLIAMLEQYGSGGNAAKKGVFVLSEIADDMRTLIGRPVLLKEPKFDFELDGNGNYRSGTYYIEDNTLYFYYTINYGATVAEEVSTVGVMTYAIN